MFKIPKVIFLLLGAFGSFAQNIDVLLLNNEYDKALHQIDNEILKQKDQPDLHYKKGILLQKKYDFSGAIKSFKTAWLLGSTNTRVISELGEVNTSLGNY